MLVLVIYIIAMTLQYVNGSDPKYNKLGTSMKLLFEDEGHWIKTN